MDKRNSEIFEEKKAAYVGFWEAIRLQDRNYDEGSKIDLSHWIVRIELVAPENVRNAIDHWVSVEPGSATRIEATKKLKDSMRMDLDVSG